MTFDTSIAAEAAYYFSLFANDADEDFDLQERLHSVYREISMTGTYTHTYDELSYGARLAWRNSTRCIGRLTWESLKVRDMRHLTMAEDIFEALVEHIQLATNGGKIQPLITIFDPQEPGHPGVRIWNSQLIRYAGYLQPDGSILGDPSNHELTTKLMRLGWKGGKRTPFDILPLAIQMPGKSPQLFEIPHDSILEVPLIHPDYRWFADLELKWHALPVISNMRLDIGGVSYSAAPFNGFYMGTEIGARNFGDDTRYNLLPIIAQKLGLNIRSDRSLWKDRALVELNVAVLYSFQKCGVTIIDHHTAAKQFEVFTQNERKQKRKAYADWGWIIPPLSPSTTPVFHQSYENRIRTPGFFYQPSPWVNEQMIDTIDTIDTQIPCLSGIHSA